MTRRLNRLLSLPIPVLRLIGTTHEVSGDELVRLGISNKASARPVALRAGGALLPRGDGSFLTTAPVDVGRLVGLHITTLRILWQVLNFAVLKALASTPASRGGAKVIAGGLLITLRPVK